MEKSTLIDCFEYEDHYQLFCNLTPDGFFSVDLDKNGLLPLNRQYYNGNKLRCILPVYENGKQYFLTVEENKTVFAKKYEKDSSSPIAEKDLGTLNVEKTIRSYNEIILLCSGNASGYVTLSSDLYTAFLEIEQTDSTVLSVLSDNGKVYFLLRDKQGNVSFMGKEPFDAAENGIMLCLPNGSLLCFLQKKSVYDYIEFYSPDVE